MLNNTRKQLQIFDYKLQIILFLHKILVDVAV
jgi:hypothetical protein